MDAMTLNRLRILIAIAEHGSFNRAAQALHLTQSAVSQHVQELEAAIGTQLFERSSRGVQATAAGSRLIDYAKNIVGMVSEAWEAVLDVNSAENQTLTIGATSGVSVYILPPWLRTFQEEHPHINLSQKTGITAEVIKGVLDNRFDFGLIVGETTPFAEPNLMQSTLDTIPYHLVVHPTHPWAQQDVIPLNALATAPYLHRQPTSRSRIWLDNSLHAYGVMLKSAALFNTPGAIKYALLSKMGVSILPAYVVERELERGELVRVALLNEDEEVVQLARPLQLLWRGAFTAVQLAFLRTIGWAGLIV